MEVVWGDTRSLDYSSFGVCIGVRLFMEATTLAPSGEITGATLVVCPAAAMLQWRNLA